jgi:hypothetical protein
MYADKASRRTGQSLPTQRSYDIASGVEDRSVMPMPVSPSQT